MYLAFPGLIINNIIKALQTTLTFDLNKIYLCYVDYRLGNIMLLRQGAKQWI